MGETQQDNVDEKAVLDIITNKAISTFFQPVVSISTKSIVGFEAFSRGGTNGECVVDPRLLFHDLLQPELKVSVDRLCREKALDHFKPICKRHPSMLMFLNLNTDILPHVPAGSKILKHQVASMDLNPSNIVIEFPMCKAHNPLVESFVALYKGFGFRISLDNCNVDEGASHAITTLKPDFVKLNPTFFAEGCRKKYSGKALEALVEVAAQAGSVVSAQGVEMEDDSIRLLTAGVHLQQGYYYTKDENDRTGDPAKMFLKKIVDTYDKYKHVRRKLVQKKKARYDSTFKAVTSVCSKFTNIQESRFEDVCKTLVRGSDNVTSMFVLDEIGEQITPRIHGGVAQCGALSAKILGSEKGLDHSMRDYFMYLDMGYEKFVSRPFVSPYSGDENCIISKPFYNSEGLRYVLCLEMGYPG